ncbi:hypothetical protein PMAYCL1PPCAC_33092 [Pristionchus mayeri]|uniref:CHK kinase-like domain-containing protein n=1 Tax=Pristionchus mayeri TaxID=1317129 RepID=A0AAN5DHS5_9BILA|nr:hypothetical protein PMAYCL1PPCAC_33092 [Pristionchus mayeri]
MLMTLNGHLHFSVMQFTELSQELKDLIFKVLAQFYILPPNKEFVKFKQIGQNRGYNSAIHKLSLEDGRSYAIKITDNEEHPVLNLLHNRELEFYEWLDGVRSETDCEQEDLENILQFFGGTRCDTEPGVLILNDLSSRVGIQPSYTIGYTPQLVFQIVKQIAGYQSVYLCAEKEVSVGKEMIKYDLPVQKALPKLDEVPWMTEEEKRHLREWTLPQNLFSIHTEIPDEIEGVSPVLAHCDLWNGNMIFEQKEDSTHLLAILDWQIFKIGNPLIDIATIIGENMTTEDRREYTEAILSLYLNEIEKRKSRFKKRFEMTKDKARLLLSLALRWPCIQTMFAVVLNPIDDPKEEDQEMGRLSIRLRELMNDVIGK